MLQIRNLYKSFGKKPVLGNINLDINYGEFVALVGPSGCGKSTLLKAILGTDLPTSGEITLDGNLVDKPSRDIGIVYQHYALYDFLTCKHNVAFGPMLDRTTLPFRFFYWWKFRKLYKQMLADSCQLLDKVELLDCYDKYPSELSGGMKQRVAIAQALIMKPKLLLLDEPFGALDESTREELQNMLLGFYQENVEAQKLRKIPPYTIIIVTHELNEAFYVADRVIGLSQYHNADIPGAQIVYDEILPVYTPKDPKNFGLFFEQKEKLRKVVFGGEACFTKN